MYHCFRLKKGQDLKREIQNYVVKHQIKAGIILCAVGCFYELNIRLAGAEEILQQKGDFEIVSVTGTLSLKGLHIHISVSDKKGNTVGGHLKDGCYINTTAEICLLELENKEFSREFDKDTGYKELIIK